MISPFVDPVTKEKVVFARGNDKDRKNLLSQHVPLDQICVAFGGSNSFEMFESSSLESYFANDEKVYQQYVQNNNNNHHHHNNNNNNQKQQQLPEDSEEDMMLRKALNDANLKDNEKVNIDDLKQG